MLWFLFSLYSSILNDIHLYSLYRQLSHENAKREKNKKESIWEYWISSKRVIERYNFKRVYKNKQSNNTTLKKYIVYSSESATTIFKNTTSRECIKNAISKKHIIIVNAHCFTKSRKLEDFERNHLTFIAKHSMISKKTNVFLSYSIRFRESVFEVALQ